MNEYNPFLYKPRMYLDRFCHEYGKIDNDTRLLHLAVFVHRGGNLQRYVNRYRAVHSCHWSDALFDTLLSNLVYLRTGDIYHPLRLILKKHLNEEQLIRLLTAELKANYVGCLWHNKIGEFRRFTMNEYDIDKYQTLEQIIYGELMDKIDIFTETAETLRDSNPWLEVADFIAENDYTIPDRYDVVHPLDLEVFKRIEKYWDAKEDNKRDLYQLRLGMPPDGTQGDPLTATVVILMLNPGYDERINENDYSILSDEQRRDYIQSRCENMSFREKICVPTNDTKIGKIINMVNGHYWEKVLDPVFNELEKDVLDVRSKIAVVNLMGYKSKKYKLVPKRLFGETPFPTQEYTLRLVRWLKEQNKLFVMGHGKEYWYNLIPGLKEYPNQVLRNSDRSMKISPKNCKDDGWDKIINALRT